MLDWNDPVKLRNASARNRRYGIAGAVGNEVHMQAHGGSSRLACEQLEDGLGEID